MKTKVVQLKTGEKAVLFRNENTGQWVQDKVLACSDNFHTYVLNTKDASKKTRTIVRYYSECKNSYTRNKIREMINKDLKNIDLLFDTILNEILCR